MSPLARRTSARPAGSGGGRGVAGRNVGTFLQRARSGRGCSARANTGDRAVAAQGGLASLGRPSSRARDTLIWPDLSTAADAAKAETFFVFVQLDYKASLSNTALHRSWILAPSERRPKGWRLSSPRATPSTPPSLRPNRRRPRRRSPPSSRSRKGSTPWRPSGRGHGGGGCRLRAQMFTFAARFFCNQLHVMPMKPTSATATSTTELR